MHGDLIKVFKKNWFLIEVKAGRALKPKIKAIKRNVVIVL